MDGVRLEAELDPAVGRWLWLVKWLLLIPHVIVLAFLWIGTFFVTVIAFFAILFTERYPRPLFDYTVGVLRWTWRVGFYGYSVLGTDRYPPFTLSDVADYPARLAIRYPERLSRGLVLVKWWLLAIPHYIVVSLFLGQPGVRNGDSETTASSLGLVAIVVLIAAIALLFTGRYPRGLFDFAMGMNRWALRAFAYAGLLTDEYPPFRLDQGAAEPTASPDAR